MKNTETSSDRYVSPTLRKALADLTAPTLMLLAPFVNFISFNHYNYLRPEVFWILAFVITFGLLLGLIMFGGGQVVRILIIAFMLSLIFEPLFDSLELELIMPITLLIVWVLREHITEIVAIAFLVMIVGTALTPGEGLTGTTRANPGVKIKLSKELPLLIHIILDEHIGIEGIPEDIETGVQIKEKLKAFYENYGFHLYGRAYSQYLNTSNSIPNTLNFTSKDINKYYYTASNKRILKDNAYFRLLSDRGYSLRVYQSTHIDFCQIPEVRIISCVTYPDNSIKSIENLPIHFKEKARFIWYSLLSTSTSHRLQWAREKYRKLREGAKLRGWELPPWSSRVPRTGPIAPMHVLEEMLERIPNSSNGTAYFAHLLLPHYPYVYDKGCRPYKRIQDWLDSRVRDWHEISNREPPSHKRNNQETRAKRYKLYFEQIECQQRMLRKLFENMKNADVYDNAIILLHGDHGSRIGEVSPKLINKNLLTANDYTDGFSTLFAVKLPGAPSGYDNNMTTLNELFAGAIGNGQVMAEPGNVFLRGENKIGVRMDSQPMVWFDQ